MSNKKKFDVKGFSYGLEDMLTDAGLTATVRTYWRDNEEHINVTFEENDDAMSPAQRESQVEALLVPEMDKMEINPGDLYSLRSYYEDGNIVVKISFKKEEDENEEV